MGSTFRATQRSHRRSRARVSGPLCRLGHDPFARSRLAARELERCVRELGLRGVQIGSHIDANTHVPNDLRNLDDRSLDPVWQAAEELGAAIFVHPWDMVGKERMPKYWLPWLVGMPAETSLAICSMMFGGVFDRFPRLRVAFAHGGGAFPFTIGRIEHGFNVRPDLVAIDSQINPRSYLARLDERGASPGALLRRFVSPRCGCTPASPQIFRRGTDRARLGLSLPLRRSASRRADRVDARFLPRRKNAAAQRKRARVSRPPLTSN